MRLSPSSASERASGSAAVPDSLGPLLVGWVTWLAASQRVGMATIIVFFAAGAALLLTVPEQRDGAGAAG